MKIPIEQIIPDPNQPRKTFDEGTIKELASSFTTYGIIAPLKVRPRGDNQYMIIAGELRYRATKERGDKEIECIVEEATDQQAREMQLIENLQRCNLSDEELGQSFTDYCKEHKCTMAELGRRIGKERRFIEDRVAIITKLNPSLHKAGAKPLTFTEKRELTVIEDKKRQVEVARPFMRGEISSTHIQRVAQIAQKQPERPVDDIIGEVVHGMTPLPKKRHEPEKVSDFGSIVKQLSVLATRLEAIDSPSDLADYSIELRLLADLFTKLASEAEGGQES